MLLLSYFGPAPNIVSKIAMSTIAAMQATTIIVFFIESNLVIKSTSYTLFKFLKARSLRKELIADVFDVIQRIAGRFIIQLLISP